MIYTSTDTSIHDNDVLCGRGGATNNHIGNKRFRSIVAEHQREYLAAKKKDKGLIARSIVQIVHERGGRFLKKQGDVWVEVDNKKAAEKTSQALREGLDVRHQEFRKDKRRDGGSFGETPSKRRKRIEGKVVSSYESPALVSESGAPNVPEMRQDEMPYVFYQPPAISTDDCDHIESV